MKTLIFTGGLGNQMFQYALLLSLRNRGYVVEADISFYSYLNMHNGYELARVFGIKDRATDKGGLHLFLLRTISKYKPKCLFSGDKLRYDENVLLAPQKYIQGYWQSELYFKDIEQQVKDAFAFQNIDSFNAELAKRMQESESVSLHIRRGDYIAYGMTLVGKDYYEKAVDIVLKKLGKVKFYIFSDDEVEARRIADDMGIDYQILNHNKGENSYKDMYLMSQCKHNIIANSSFSWWGAWLNDNPNKVVVAPKWLTDFNCRTWIEI